MAIFRALRGNASLVVTPIIIVVAAIALFLYNTTADIGFSEKRALDWDRYLRPQLEQHVSIAIWSTIFVVAIAIPLGIFLTRPTTKRFGAPILAVATSGQAMPAFGLLVLTYTWLNRGSWPTVYALVFFSLLPVLRNTMVGLTQVNPAVVEAARGMGMTKGQALRRIELPLSVPIMLAGVRTALVINVGMAALAYLTGGGGLGITISKGISLQRDSVLITGAVLTAIVALTIDWLAALIERALRPRGL